MADEIADPASPAPIVDEKRPRSLAREVNTVEPAAERARKRTSPASEADREPNGVRADGPSLRLGDVPGVLQKRYFTESVRGGAALAFYEGPGAKAVAFHDHGGKLSTDRLDPAIARDLAAIAAHRGWTTLQVRGEDDFRREVWMEARALGLAVKGYKPRERDQQELQPRLASQERRARGTELREIRDQASGRDRTQTPSPAPLGRADFDKGVDGVLVASGEAPYRRRTGEPPTPFIRVDRGGGKPVEIWGAGLPDALTRAGAAIGDQVRVRRDGVDTVHKSLDVRDPKTGEITRQTRDVPRNRWEIEADRFRRASPGEAARDPDLKGAQTHLAIVDAIIDSKIKDPESRARLHAEARDLVAGELAEGRRFEPARVREVEPVLAHDLAQAVQRDRDGPERGLRR